MGGQAVAYLRLSHQSQASEDRDGLTRQRTAIEAWASKEKVEIVQWYIDTKTGTTDERPELARMLVDLKVNHSTVSLVVIERADRLARELGVQEMILREINILGRTLVSAVEGSLDGDPSRTLVRQILGAVAQHDRSMLTGKMRAARDRKSKQLGHRIEGRPALDDPKVLERIRSLRRAMPHKKTYKRMSYARIAEVLTVEGFQTQTGASWHGSTVRAIVQRECPSLL